MPQRFYSSTAVATTLDNNGLAADPTAVTCTVLSVAGFPDTPFTLVIDPDTTNEEIVTVTSRSGNNLTVARNQESSGLKEHAGLAPAKHMITGRDLQEANTHVNSSTNVHGITSEVVGRTDPQVLRGKEIRGDGSNPNTFGAIPQAAIVNLTADLSNKAPLASPSLSNPTFTGTVTASGASAVTLPSNTTIGNVSSTELSRLDGVTSPVQTQLDAKAVYPSQSGNAGKFLTTDGSATSWATVSGGTGTVTGVTAGTGLTANSVSGGTISTSGTLAIDSTVATLTGTQTLTNKTIGTGSSLTTDVTAVTQTSTDNSTKVATTAFVKSVVGTTNQIRSGTTSSQSIANATASTTTITFTSNITTTNKPVAMASVVGTGTGVATVRTEMQGSSGTWSGVKVTIYNNTGSTQNLQVDWLVIGI
jgi:hypothetical protein